MSDRWSFDDCTKANGGYGRILLDGKDVCLDVFPFRRGADPPAVKKLAAAIVEVLNAANHWRSCPPDGSGPERLESAVDALRDVNEMAEEIY